MIYTSYFDNIKNLPEHYIPIAICGKCPENYTGLKYSKLAPKLSFWKEWEQNHDNKFYEEKFNELVLDKLDVLEVVNELYCLARTKMTEEEKMMLDIVNCPPWSNDTVHIVLICYEKPGEFCHRHLVSKWFNETIITSKEL